MPRPAARGRTPQTPSASVRHRRLRRKVTPAWRQAALRRSALPWAGGQPTPVAAPGRVVGTTVAAAGVAGVAVARSGRREAAYRAAAACRRGADNAARHAAPGRRRRRHTPAQPVPACRPIDALLRTPLKNGEMVAGRPLPWPSRNVGNVPSHPGARACASIRPTTRGPAKHDGLAHPRPNCRALGHKGPALRRLARHVHGGAASPGHRGDPVSPAVPACADCFRTVIEAQLPQARRALKIGRPREASIHTKSAT